MIETTYHQGKRETILNRAMEYYENDKERLRGPARNKYRELSEEEKNKRENIQEIDIIICLKKRDKN